MLRHAKFSPLCVAPSHLPTPISTLQGHTYFTCKNNHGTLVDPEKVTAADDDSE